MIREPAVAGAFYPAEPDQLRSEVIKYLTAAPDMAIKDLKGIIVPHAGYIYSAPVAAYGFKQLTSLPKLEYNVFLLGPAHFVYTNASVGNFESFETPLGSVPVNQEICNELLKNSELKFDPEPHVPEHNLEVQLPFLQLTLNKFKIIPILLGGISADLLSEILVPYLKQENSLLVVSSDLSHYMPYESAKASDLRTIKIIENIDIDNEEDIDACGEKGIKTALRVAKKLSYKIKLLDYRNSGDTAGDKSAVVGYSSLAITK